jgi:hypothetical protein
VAYAPKKVAMRNGSGWLSLILGALTVGYALFQSGNFVLGQGFAASTAGICAISYGVFALALRRRQEANLFLAPSLGIILGIAGTGIMGTYVAAHYLNNSDTGLPEIGIVAGTDFSDVPTLATEDEVATAVTSPPEEQVAPSTPQNSTDEYYALAQHAGTAAFVLKQIYPGSKPEALTLSGSEGTLSTIDGRALTQLPAGTAFTYSVSADRQDFMLTLIGVTFGTRVTYDTVADTLT